MSHITHVITAVSFIAVMTLAAHSASATVDPMSLPPCDFSNGIPQGMTLAELQAIAADPAAYKVSANPICNPYLGKGEITMPLPQNMSTTIAWPVPYVAPTPQATPTPTPTQAPQVLAAATAPVPTVLPDTGASAADVVPALLVALVTYGLVRRIGRIV